MRAGIHPGFGRLVLEWPRRSRSKAGRKAVAIGSASGGRSQAALDPVVARLGAYLTSAHLGPDRRELAFELAPGIAVRQAVEHGRIVVLDLAPDSTVRQAIPEGRIVVSDLPPVASAEQVKVRAGLHDGFGRAVFEWSLPTTFEAVAAAGRVDIRFSRAGDIDPPCSLRALAPGSRVPAQPVATVAAMCASSCSPASARGCSRWTTTGSPSI